MLFCLDHVDHLYHQPPSVQWKPLVMTGMTVAGQAFVTDSRVDTMSCLENSPHLGIAPPGCCSTD